ncbi:MAG TPA: phage tail tape measure protein [Methanothrix sp.]|nr:phage tail tape measure protein [Methanothrix sp.]
MPADAGRITAQIDGDISGLKTALGQARNEATNAVSGIEGSFKSNLGAGLRDSMSGIASSMGPVGSALSAIGPAGIAAGAGIAVVGSALSSSVTTAAGFQQQMAGVAAIMGSSGAELQAMSNAAREAGASTQFSASQAAEALSYMAGAGWDSQQATAGLKDTLTMAAAGGMDLASAGDMMTNTISQFNLEATDSGRVANVLAAGAAETNTNISQLGGGLKEVGSTASAFGMSLESTTAALGSLSNAGIKGAEGGTALRGILAGLASQSGPAAEALAELGISAEQINPATVGVAEAMSLLNEKGMTATQALQIFGRENVSAATYLAAETFSRPNICRA